ncbi:MAG: hypothetical protein U1E94_02730 [Agitococcus sp.]
MRVTEIDPICALQACKWMVTK